MKYFNSCVLSFLFVVMALNLMSAMGNNSFKNTPLRASKIKIQDGEFIKMAHYTGGELSSEDYIVARLDENKNRLEIYWQSLNLKLKQKLPDHYTNFNTWHTTIDLQLGSVISSVYNNPVTNAKDLIRASVIRNEDSGEITSLDEYWDGANMKISRATMTTRKDFPIFDLNSTYYIVRFLDVATPGIAYLCIPQIFKNPIPATFNYIGKEVIKTPAGVFNTVKFTLIPTDPFLAKLMESYTKQGIIWMEDSPRRLLVKATAPTGYTIVEEVSTIREKGME